MAVAAPMKVLAPQKHLLEEHRSPTPATSSSSSSPSGNGWALNGSTPPVRIGRHAQSRGDGGGLGGGAPGSAASTLRCGSAPSTASAMSSNASPASVREASHRAASASLVGTRWLCGPATALPAIPRQRAELSVAPPAG